MRSVIMLPRRRDSIVALLASLSLASPLAAQEGEHAAAGGGGLMSPNPGLMFWTLVIFFTLLFILRRFAFPPIIDAVAAREKALEDAIEGAKRDREAAAKILEEQRAHLESARGEAQRFIAEAHAQAEKLRADSLEQTRQQQQEMLERARKEIGSERDRALAELRREAVDLALLGASKVVEKNLDSDTNRKLVESFLGSIDQGAVRAGTTGRR